ncbi:MAG: Lrp/AsnC family transcriptional regulator [Proteobacteria bacterium]|nr:MAG: Lrp/AsnC family transcriptional regulator [Pseudomonadota bacterium]
MDRPNREARHFINRFQGGFPLHKHPFRLVAAALEMGEIALIQLVRELVEERWLSRFGPVYNASRIGGAQTLAALEAPEARFGEVSEIVNAFGEVAHNYRREHRLNMWFVLATEGKEDIARTLRRIEEATGLSVYDFPKLREFYLGLQLHLADDGGVDTVPTPAPGKLDGYALDDTDRALVVATQAGLPLQLEPYAIVAEQIGIGETEVLERLGRMLETGAIRRIGAVPNHYRLGLSANGMTVWDVDDASLAEAGAAIAALPFVSHCYERPRHRGVWPYNLFAMVHGVSRDEVAEKTVRIAGVLGDRCRASDVLVSSACLKKTGLRLAA